MSDVLIEELTSFMSLNFISYDCIHVPRDCNNAAHALAAFGVGSTKGMDSVIVVDNLSTSGQ